MSERRKIDPSKVIYDGKTMRRNCTDEEGRQMAKELAEQQEWTAALLAAAREWQAKGCIEGQKMFYNNRTRYADADFIAGASWARTFELEREAERAKALVEALKRCYSNSITPTGTAHDAMIDAALAAYGGQREHE